MSPETPSTDALLTWIDEQRWDMVLPWLSQESLERPDLWKNMISEYVRGTEAQAQVAIVLLEHMPDLDWSTQKTHNAWTSSLLIQAVQGGHVNVVKQVLRTWEQQGFDLNEVDRKGLGHLMYAAQQGHLSMLQLLWDAPGIDRQVCLHQDVDDAMSPLLIEAAHAGQSEVVRWLLQQPEAPVDTVDRYGCNALIAAAQAYSLDTLNVLLAAGGSPVCTDNSGRVYNVLQAAVDHSGTLDQRFAHQTPAETDSFLTTFFSRLVDVVDPLVRDSMNDTPLSAAVSRGHAQVTKVLLPLCGELALHQDGVGRSLLQQGFDSALPTTDSPLSTGHAQVLDLLLTRFPIDMARTQVQRLAWDEVQVQRCFPKWFAQEETRVLHAQVGREKAPSTSLGLREDRPRL